MFTHVFHLQKFVCLSGRVGTSIVVGQDDTAGVYGYGLRCSSIFSGKQMVVYQSLFTVGRLSNPGSTLARMHLVEVLTRAAESGGHMTATDSRLASFASSQKPTPNGGRARRGEARRWSYPHYRACMPPRECRARVKQE